MMSSKKPEIHNIGMPPKEDRATATGNYKHENFVRYGHMVLRYTGQLFIIQYIQKYGRMFFEIHSETRRTEWEACMDCYRGRSHNFTELFRGHGNKTVLFQSM